MSVTQPSTDTIQKVSTEIAKYKQTVQDIMTQLRGTTAKAAHEADAMVDEFIKNWGTAVTKWRNQSSDERPVPSLSDLFALEQKKIYEKWIVRRADELKESVYQEYAPEVVKLETSVSMSEPNILTQGAKSLIAPPPASVLRANLDEVEKRWLAAPTTFTLRGALDTVATKVTEATRGALETAKKLDAQQMKLEDIYSGDAYNFLSAADKGALIRDELQHLKSQMSQSYRENLEKNSPPRPWEQVWDVVYSQVNSRWEAFRRDQLLPYGKRAGVKTVPRPQSIREQPANYVTYLKDQLLAGNFVPFLKYLSNEETGGYLAIPQERPGFGPPHFTQDQIDAAFQGKPRAVNNFTKKIIAWLGGGALAISVTALLYHFGKEWYQTQEEKKEGDRLEWYQTLDLIDQVDPSLGAGKMRIKIKGSPSKVVDHAWDTLFYLFGTSPTRRQFKELKPGVSQLTLDIPFELTSKEQFEKMVQALKTYLRKQKVFVRAAKLALSSKHPPTISILVAPRKRPKGEEKSQSKRRRGHKSRSKSKTKTKSRSKSKSKE